jgi:glucose-6-phosphate-specific signal transduction histidine kinase
LTSLPGELDWLLSLLSPPAEPGVVGLSDRVTALEGRLSVQSPPDGGTILAATLPLDSH